MAKPRDYEKIEKQDEVTVEHTKQGKKSNIDFKALKKKVNTILKEHEINIVNKDIAEIYKVMIDGEPAYAMKTYKTKPGHLDKVPEKLLGKLPVLADGSKTTRPVNLNTGLRDGDITDVDYEKQLQLVNIDSK